MNGLMNILDAIGADPMAKWVVAAFAMRAAWTILAGQRCPLCSGKARVDPAEAAQVRKEGAFRHSWRFLLVMLLGMALAVAGLFKLAAPGAEAPLALFLLVLGVYLFTTEPARQQISVLKRQVIAASYGDPAARATAVALLRGAQLKLAAMEVGIVLLMAVGVLALGGGMT